MTVDVKQQLLLRGFVKFDNVFSKKEVDGNSHPTTCTDWPAYARDKIKPIAPTDTGNAETLGWNRTPDPELLGKHLRENNENS